MRPIHPFPARMAPDTVGRLIRGLPTKATILDPMCGSGVVLRLAAQMGIASIGFDIDPLAVLMSRVWTRKTSVQSALCTAETLVQRARRRQSHKCRLPWIDDCPETKQFVRYWFASRQRLQLRRLSFVLMKDGNKLPSHIRECLWLALSRTIVTKHTGASLAWDVSHSRPHKVRDENDFDVDAMFLQSTARLVQLLDEEQLDTSSRVRSGDSRKLANIQRHSIDAVITSPPYLNAIDYLRGHKLSLIWMGHSIPWLRRLRSTSIGTEAANLNTKRSTEITSALNNLRRFADLPSRQQNIVRKYACDAFSFLTEMHRVIKPGGRLSLVLGDSNLRGSLIENSKLFSHLARDLPPLKWSSVKYYFWLEDKIDGKEEAYG
jgi:DNA modification methylase